MKKIVLGKIYANNNEIVESMVIEDNKIVYVGNSLEAKNKYPDYEIEDHKDYFICPGFNDSHMHLVNLGYFLGVSDCKKNSLKEMIEGLKIDVKNIKEGSWLLGRGWNHDYFTDEKRFPNRYDLDEVSKDIPVFVTRACGHVASVNSKALEIMDLLNESKDVEGGEIEIDENGIPTGVFKENAISLVQSYIPGYKKEDVKKMIEESSKFLNSYGITSCQSDDLISLSNVDYHTIIEAYEECIKEGKLTVRVNEQAQFEKADKFKNFFEEGFYPNWGNEYFKIGPLKLIGDGSLGARTAFMSRPYNDDQSTRGIPVYTEEQLEEMVKIAESHKMQVAIHSIGDACLDRVLNAYEKNIDLSRDHRSGVVHIQITRKDQLERVAKLKLHAYIQSIFLDYDSKIVRDRVADLADTSYAFKTLKELGVCISNGSDSPVEMPDCLAGITTAVTRASLGQNNVYLPNEALSIKEAIDSFTINGAYASFEENVKGLIKEGMYADYVVLEKNLFEIDPKTIKDVKIISTYLAGNRVY